MVSTVAYTSTFPVIISTDRVETLMGAFSDLVNEVIGNTMISHTTVVEPGSSLTKVTIRLTSKRALRQSDILIIKAFIRGAQLFDHAEARGL